MNQLNRTVHCKICGQLHDFQPLAPGTVAECVRCGSRLAKSTKAGLGLTAAFSLAALILYVPANTFPIMRYEAFNAVSENTVWQGVVRLYDSGDQIVAIVVFLASIVIPALKLLGLFFLAASVKLRWSRWKVQRAWLYRIIDAVGRWAMLDVFVLAVLVSLVKLRGLSTVLPGTGLLAFTAVVVLTLFASSSFDPQLIWSETKAEPQR